MKILKINTDHYHRGGADNVYFNTAKLLSKQGHDVFFFSSKGEKTLDNKDIGYFYPEIDYRKISTINKILKAKDFIYNKTSYNNLLKYIYRINPDIAHIHLFMGGATVSILRALKKRKIPIIHSVHDYRLICPNTLLFDNTNRICEQCKDGVYLRCLSKRCSQGSIPQSAILTMDAYFRKNIIKPIDKIDHFLFVSHFARDKHVAFNSGYRNKSDVLYNFAPDLLTVNPSKKKGKYFLYYGRISREKGLQTLIKSAIKAKVNLKIAGTGPLLNEIKNINSDNIEFLGHKTGKELWSIVRNSSFIIVPSEWYENNPLTIIESYSYGKPVIGARIGGIPEIVNENKTGYLFSPGDTKQLEKILIEANELSEGKYIKMSNSARLFAENNFNSKLYYNRLIKIYNKII